MQNRRVVDLSVSIDPAHWEPEPVTRVEIPHQAGADLLGKSYMHFTPLSWWRKLVLRVARRGKYFIDHRDFPDGMGLSLMFYRLTTHTGTHIDAPYHYGWREGSTRLPRTVTEIPLSWCYGRGLVLDFSDEFDAIDAEAMSRKCAEIGRDPQPGDIVLINTGAFTRLGASDYFTDYRAIGRDGVAWLVERGVRVIGTDAFSFDPPFVEMIQAYKKSGDKDTLWPAHFYGRDHEYLQIERLGNLGELPGPTGFMVCCFPIKLEKADAAWSRVVAILDDEEQ
jgi:kynurenine formamidase